MIKVLTIHSNLVADEIDLYPVQIKVIHAMNVWDGIHLFSEHSPDVVIVGGQKPDEVLKTIITFREEQLPEARFIALVQGDPTEVEAFTRQAGIYGVRQIATVPAPPDQLGAMIKELSEIPRRSFHGNLPTRTRMPLTYSPIAAD